MHIAAYPVTPLTHPNPSIAAESNANGTYRLPLPRGTYILKAFGPKGASIPFYGEATDVVVTVGWETTADIIVTEQADRP